MIDNKQVFWQLFWKYVQRVAIAIAAIYLIWRLKQTVQLMLVSLFFAAAITPLVETMERRRIKRAWAIAIIYVGVFFVIILTIAPAPKLIFELGQFLTRVPQLILQIQIPDFLHSVITPQQLNDLVKSSTVIDQAQNMGREIVGQTVNFTLGLINALGITLLTMLITAFMVINAKELIRKSLGFFHKNVKEQVHKLIPPITRCLGAYVMGRIGTSALLGFCTYLVLVVIGVEFSSALGLLVAVSNLVPFVGPILGLIPMVVAAWSLGIFKVGAVIGASFFLQQIEAWILQPWLVGPYLNLDPFELLLSTIIGAELFGVVGALIAPPLTGVGRIIFDHFYQKQVVESEAQPDVLVLSSGENAEDE